MLGDYVLLSRRLTHVHVAFPSGGTGQTWVIAGSDSRSSLPAGPKWYGTANQVPGERADVVVVVHQYDGKTSALSIPRDMLVIPAKGHISRLTLTLNQSPQWLVNGLCTTLRIPATHLVIVTMNAFTKVVDALGGITVNVPHPVRDLFSGLDINQTGNVHIDGLEALALVRSRHPEQLIRTKWVPATLSAGSAGRTYWAGHVFAALGLAAQGAHRNPITAQRVLWAATDGMKTDQNTSLWSLKDIDLAGTPVRDLPGRQLANNLAVTANAATRQALADAGYGPACRAPSQ